MPRPDPAQRAALDAAAAGPAVITGGAGTGKSTVAVWAMVEAIEGGLAPERAVLLAPTREAAARLRDVVSLAVGRPSGVPLVRTAPSLAYDILSTHAALEGEPRPSLITGAEQDVILRELLEGQGAASHLEWGGLPPEAIAMPAFRAELRNVLMRAAEADITAEHLAALGNAARLPVWEDAAAVYQEYQQVMALRSLPSDQGQRYDAASICARAADVLADWPQGPAPQWSLVVVDDFQDATAATTAMIRELARAGARVVLIGNADEAVQGYRGGVAAGLAQAAASGGFAGPLELTTDHRQGALGAVSAAIAQRVGVKGVGSARESARLAASVAAPVGSGSLPDAGLADYVAVRVAPHRYAQSRAIAAELRHARHRDGLPWNSMVVIARSRAQLRAIRSDLLAADVPVESLGDGMALHLASAVAPLLTLLRVAGGEPWTEESALEVVGSRLVGLDSVGVRRLRRALVAEDRAGGGLTPSSQLLVEALADPARFATLRGPEAAAVARAARAVVAARERAAAPDATPGAVIRAVWSELGVADSWRAAALAGSARDDADLDSIIALLRAAQTFTERLPTATTGAFLEYLEGQDFAVDSLGARGASGDAVAFCTPASAAGREWDLVVIAGLEEGVWPDLRLRDSVLGAQRLAEVLAEGWDAAGERALPQRDLRQARRDVLDDETRALLVAVSRARTRLIVTAVEDGDSRPSRYVHMIEAAAGVSRMDVARSGGIANGGVADLRAAVARLRAAGAAGADEAVAATLARLADLGEPGADPRQWHGVAELSSQGGLWREDQPVRVSPSRIDSVARCPLRWALETTGGTAATSAAQNVGTLIHEIAAEHPHGSTAELRAALAERMPQGATWVEQRAYQNALGMIDKLGAYIASSAPERLEVETSFSVSLGRAVLGGQADRVEIEGDEARIVDLKTGRAITRAEGETNGQLMMYQLAANSGGFEGVTRASGAALVFVGAGAAQRSTVVPQAPIDDDLAREVLDATVETMAGERFLAIINPMCPGCPVRRACPAHPQGDQVGDRAEEVAPR